MAFPSTAGLKTDVFEHYELYVTADKFFVEPLASDGSPLPPPENQVLVIDRLSEADVHFESPQNIPPPSSVEEKKRIRGVFGIVHLVAGPYLIVITRAELVGIINGHKIYTVMSTELFSFSRTTLHLTERQVRDNRRVYAMIQNLLDTPGFYFSYTFDLTHSLQRLANTDPNFRHTAMHERADQRFFWNRNILGVLKDQHELHRFALPVMLGFVECRSCTVGGPTGARASFQLSLISRRSCYRAGTRFHSRGADLQGNPANFIETEQVLEFGKHLSAFVQVRGSIPLLWSQKPNLKWQPYPKLDSDPLKQQQAFRSHINNQRVIYSLTQPGSYVILNLVNGSGREGKVLSQLESAVTQSQLPVVKYEHFDFHKECKNMDWSRLQLLVGTLGSDLKKFGYFKTTVGSEGFPVEPRTQGGYFRTNCMDCLDRTNVVQSLLSLSSLKEQLRDAGLLGHEQRLEDQIDFMFLFKNMWADHGDMLSKQYAGTGALKADFTRTGTRTLAGLLNDGWNALHRYYLNNFRDGFRQDSFNLFLGAALLDPEVPLPMEEGADWRTYVLYGLVFAVCMLILTMLLATEHTLSFFLFWSVVCFFLLAIIVLNGEEFVDKPKLKQE